GAAPFPIHRCDGWRFGTAGTHRPSRVSEGVRILHSVPARGVYALERDQSGRLLLLHTLPLRRTGALRPERSLWPLEHDWHRHLPDRRLRAGALSRYGSIYRTAGRPARWGRYLVDPRAAGARGSVLSARQGLAAPRAATPDPAAMKSEGPLRGKRT